jgi:uncharacterized repeat protein (TIGR03803 family)
MKSFDFGRYALSICVAATMPAGCGGGSTPLSPSVAGLTAERTRPNVTYELLHSFTGADGKYPYAGLINVNGTLYGTTYDGGPNSLGTVFAITPSGAETVVYSLKGIPDGALPEAGLVNVGDTLYGTSGGGTKGLGAVFKVTTSGHETLLHSFRGGSGDGSFPVAGLVDVDGTLYGTTLHGGGAGCRTRYVTSGCGTIFSITTSGVETVLHKFAGGAKDGESPTAALVNVNGTLYGTTAFGGPRRVRRGYGCSSLGCGTVFAITTSGKETVLHSFGSGPGDGAYPQAGLLNVNGTLYGTTVAGPANCKKSGGCGTVFAITTSGTETVLYSFKSSGGASPEAGLINLNGTLYGTTYYGGAKCKDGDGCGTVFAITTSGRETVLHSFGGKEGGDGAHPVAGLIDVGDTLYGTTHYGGTGGGTVFSLSL